MREPFPDQVRKELLKLVKGLDQGVKPTDTRTVHRNINLHSGSSKKAPCQHANGNWAFCIHGRKLMSTDCMIKDISHSSLLDLEIQKVLH